MNEIIPAHQWMNGGAEVLILRCCAKDGTSYGGFQWPLTVGATVEAPDWTPDLVCRGLHGWPWGIGMGGAKEPQWDGTWIVFGAAPDDVKDLTDKCAARAGIVRFVGDWQAATAFVFSGQIAWVQHAARGAASATGLNSRAQAGKWGCIALAFDAGDHQEMRCAHVGVGDGSDGNLKAGVWYRLDESGAFVECV